MENPIKEAITKYLEMEIPYKWEEAPAWATFLLSELS